MNKLNARSVLIVALVVVSVGVFGWFAFVRYQQATTPQQASAPEADFPYVEDTREPTVAPKFSSSQYVVIAIVPMEKDGGAPSLLVTTKRKPGVLIEECGSNYIENTCEFFLVSANETAESARYVGSWGGGLDGLRFDTDIKFFGERYVEFSIVSGGGGTCVRDIYRIDLTAGTTSMIDSGSCSSDRSEKVITFNVGEDSLDMIVNGRLAAGLTLSDTGMFARAVDPSAPPKAFITEHDINFDGYPDVARLSSTGYSGVNYIYEYLVVDPVQEKFVRFEQLDEISNFKFDAMSKTIVSSYRSGPSWYSDTYTWNGSGYTKSTSEVQ